MLVRLFRIVCASAVAALALSGCQAPPVAPTQSTTVTLTVPDVIGLTASTAQEWLNEVGLDSSLSVGDNSISDSDLSDPSSLVVVRISPDPGSQVSSRSLVTLSVSRQPDQNPTPTASPPPAPAPVAPAPAPPPIPSCPTGKVEFSLITGWFANITSDLNTPAFYGFAPGTVKNRSNFPVQVSFPPGGWGMDAAGNRLVPMGGAWTYGTPDSIPPGGLATFSLRTGVGYPTGTASQVTRFVTEELGQNAATFISSVPDGCSHRATIVDAPPVPAEPLR
jgi:hypothetical protein